MLIFRKSLRSLGLMGICVALGGNGVARDGYLPLERDGYLPLETDSWSESSLVNSSASGSLASSTSSLSEEYFIHKEDPDIIYYCKNFLFGDANNQLEPQLATQSGEEPGQESERDQTSNQHPSGLQNELAVDLNTYNEDAQEYILCHTDLKTIWAQGHQICNALLKMKQLGVAGNSDFLDQNQRNMLNIEFKAHVDVIPMILNIKSAESKMGDEPILVTLPEGYSIILPTYKPIVDQVQNLQIVTRADACFAQNTINKLIPQTAAIIDDLARLEYQVLLLIHDISHKIELTIGKLKQLEQKLSESQNDNLQKNSDCVETITFDTEDTSISQESSEDESSDTDDLTRFKFEKHGYSDKVIVRALMAMGDELNSYLHDMKKDADKAYSEKENKELIELLDIDFQYRIQRISEMFGYGARKPAIGYEETAYTLPWEETINVPGYKPIVDKIQGLTLLEKKEAFRASCILEELMPQTMGIIFEIALATLNIQ